VRICALAFASAFLVAGCGHLSKLAISTHSSIEVKRNDGSLVRFSDHLFADCHEEDGHRVLKVQSAQVPSARPRPGFWTFSRATDSIQDARELDFPEHETNGGAFFVYDPRTKYELSSEEPGAAGGLVVERWGCGPGDEVRIRVSGKLQSDIDGLESVTPVAGEIVAAINN
jgi:hypothetical protein